MKKIIIKNCKRELLYNLIKEATQIDKLVNIQIDKENTTCKTHIHKMVIKYINIDNKNLFENDYELDKPIIISLPQGSITMVYLNQYQSNKIDLEITYDDKSTDDCYYAKCVVFSDTILNITNICCDKDLDAYKHSILSQKIVDQLIDTTNSKFCFEVFKEDLKLIRSLCNVNSNNNELTINSDSDKLELIIDNNSLYIKDITEEGVELFSKKMRDYLEFDNIKYNFIRSLFSYFVTIEKYVSCVCTDGGINRMVFKTENDNDKVTIYIVTALG